MCVCLCNEHMCLCTRTHTCTHACTHARTHACTHARTHIHTHTCTHACTHARTRTHTCTHACTHARTHACTHARTRTHTCTHACTHARTRTHTCTHACTHARTHIHTHTLYTGTKVAQAEGGHRRTFLAQFRPDSSTKFVSCGVKHVRFWTLAGTQLISKQGALPKSLGAHMQTMLSLAFAPVNCC